jgi:16S rRNA (cytidine1402-2'-O)-methyltransferase
MKGLLYIVSTPIGNLEDITLRALRVLKEVDVIAAEDTRHSLKLLNHYGISKPMISYWKEKEQVRSDEIMKRLLSGRSVALISDAGTPGISDPGAVLIRKAIEEHIQIIPVPGASAFVTALSLSGLPTDEFTFLGFLPAGTTRRQKVLEELCLERRTLIFYEAPHRIIETLTDMEMIFNGRKIAVAKEITKMHEKIFRGAASEVIAALNRSTISGEYVIVVEGNTAEGKHTVDEVLPEVFSLIKKGLGRKEAVRRVSDIYGLSKKELYSRSLKDEIA